MLTCRFCGSHNIKKVGGDNGNPFGRKGEKLVCGDCGRTLVDEVVPADLLSTLVSKIERQIQEGTPWRARSSAETLAEFLSGFSVTQEDYQKAVELYELLARFYRNVCDVKKAYAFAKKGSDIAFAFDDIPLSADMAYTAYRHAEVLPEELRPAIDEEKIQKDYGRYATNVLSYKRFSPMKVDPIEHTETFLSVYDEVMERVTARLEKEGNLHMPQQTWSFMAEEFAKKGIYWRSPGLMNPTWRFD